MEASVWSVRSPQPAGLSPGGSTLGQCSICGAGDFECDHVNGEVYDGARCFRVITRFDLTEVSLVSRPYDPRCYKLDKVIPVSEVERQLGRRPGPGESLACEHCQACVGAPTDDELNPTAWA